MPPGFARWQLRLPSPPSHPFFFPIHRNKEEWVVFAINNAQVLKHHRSQAGCYASPINCSPAKCIFARYLVLSFDCMCLILIIIGVAHCHWARHVSHQIRLNIVYWSLADAHLKYDFYSSNQFRRHIVAVNGAITYVFVFLHFGNGMEKSCPHNLQKSSGASVLSVDQSTKQDNHHNHEWRHG